MYIRFLGPVLCILFMPELHMLAQPADTLFDLSAIVYDETYVPVPATHVINMFTHQGYVTDSLGMFHIAVHPSDSLLIRNIVFRDTIVPVKAFQERRYIRLKRKSYPLEEAKIFQWGTTYDDFREALLGMPEQQTLGEALDLPQQNPDKVPLEMDENAVNSIGLLLTSPISYFYYNFNKQAKSARKVYWLKKNQEKQDQFDALVSAENLSEITGLTGPELQDFKFFLSQRMVCGIHCSELEVYSEIYRLWDLYKEFRERGMLDNPGN